MTGSGFNKSMFVSLLLISIIFFSMSSVLFGMANFYGVSIDEENADLFNIYNDTRTQIETQETILSGGDINPEGQDQAVYTNVIVTGKTARKSLQLGSTLLYKMPEIFGIDATIIGMIVGLISFLASMAFLVMITKQAP